MSWTEDAKKTLELSSAALHGLETIGTMAKSVSDSKDISQLTGALVVITAVVDAIRSGFAGTSTAIDTTAEVKRLHNAVTTNDAHAQSELDKKFPT